MNQSKLKEIIDYKKETGEFVWRVRPRSHFINSMLHKRWNTKYSGKPAGTNRLNGYRAITIDQNPYYAHRLAMLYVFGEMPEAVDHINGVRNDNRIENLRAATTKMNAKNVRRRKDNTSGVTGVYKGCKGKGWRSYIASEGEFICLGHFDCFDDAVAARKKAEKEYGFHENHGRVHASE